MRASAIEKERVNEQAYERASERRGTDGESEREQKRDRDKESRKHRGSVPSTLLLTCSIARHRPSRRSQEHSDGCLHMSPYPHRSSAISVGPLSSCAMYARGTCITNARRVSCVPSTLPLSICLSFYDFFPSILLRFFSLLSFFPGIFHVFSS